MKSEKDYFIEVVYEIFFFFNYSSLGDLLREEIIPFSHSGRCAETEFTRLSLCLPKFLLKSSLSFKACGFANLKCEPPAVGK